MRYVLVLITTLVALLALACGGGGGKQPGSTASLAATEPSGAAVDIGDLLLQPEDVPSDVASLGPPRELRANALLEDLFTDRIESDDITQEEIASWHISGAALQVYNSTEQYPAQGVQFLYLAAFLSDSTDGAKGLFSVARIDLERRTIAIDESYPGRDLLQFDELSQPARGDEFRMVHYVSATPQDSVRLESYRLILRRGRAVVMLQIRAPEGNMTRDQVDDMTARLDERMRAALG